MEKIKGQASRVSELVFAADTAATYQRALVLTLNILRETAVLLWLAICLVFVGGEWFWKNSISLGRKGRDWYNDLQAPSTEEPKSATAIGQSALTAIGSSTETLLYKAKQQLGIDAEPPAPKPVTPTVTATPEPAAPAPPPAPQAIAAPPTAEALSTDSEGLEDDDSEL